MPKLVVDHVTLHYQCLGEGENLVLIHGLGASLAFWYFGIASNLSNRYRVIIYDLRGHGKSSMPLSGYTMQHMTHDLYSLLEHLDVKSTHIVGHSLGARIALEYTINYPEQVKTLTLADTGCLQPRTRLRDWHYWETYKQELQQQSFSLPTDDELITFRLLMRFHQVSGRLSAGEGLGAKKERTASEKRGKKRQLVAQWEQLLNTTSAKQEFCESEQMTEAEIEQITVPTLAIYGEHSHCLPSCWQLHKLIDNCRVVIIPRGGHFHPTHKPRLFVRALLKFLRNYSSSPGGIVTVLEVD